MPSAPTIPTSRYPESELHVEGAVGARAVELESLADSHVFTAEQLAEWDLQTSQAALMLLISDL